MYHTSLKPLQKCPRADATPPHSWFVLIIHISPNCYLTSSCPTFLSSCLIFAIHVQLIPQIPPPFSFVLVAPGLPEHTEGTGWWPYPSTHVRVCSLLKYGPAVQKHSVPKPVGCPVTLFKVRSLFHQILIVFASALCSF